MSNHFHIKENAQTQNDKMICAITIFGTVKKKNP